jgi:hypothetical protein
LHECRNTKNFMVKVVSPVVLVIVMLVAAAVAVAVAVARSHSKCLNNNIPLQISILLFYNHLNTLHKQS